jgi:phosphatidylglycerophosphate synthase
MKYFLFICDNTGMNLHRTLGKPDWHDTPLHKRTNVQKIAASSHGIATPGNAISIVGIILVCIGCAYIIAQHYWIGAVLVVIGRVFDLLDGWAAEITKTKGPVGEFVDASFDKFATIGIVITMFIAEIVAWPLLIALLLPQVIITIISFYKRAQGYKIHPSLTGKVSMAATWAAVAILLVAKATGELPVVGEIGVSVTVIAILLGLTASIQYMNQSSK